MALAARTAEHSPAISRRHNLVRERMPHGTAVWPAPPCISWSLVSCRAAWRAELDAMPPCSAARGFRHVQNAGCQPARFALPAAYRAAPSGRLPGAAARCTAARPARHPPARRPGRQRSPALRLAGYCGVPIRVKFTQSLQTASGCRLSRARTRQAVPAGEAPNCAKAVNRIGIACVDTRASKLATIGAIV